MPKLSSIFCLMPQHSTPIMLEMFKEEGLVSVLPLNIVFQQN